MASTRSDRITALYNAEADHLLRMVRGAVGNADWALIEDACAFSWAQLVRRVDVDPDDPRVVGWLLRIATREGWEQARRQTAASEDPVILDVPATASVEAFATAREAIAYVGELPERQRRIVLLSAAGLSREELAAATGDTLRTIDRQLARARETLRARRGE